MKPGDHLEILCQAVQDDLNGFISLMHCDWYDLRIKELSKEWQVKTREHNIDNHYFIQAKTSRDKRIVSIREFHSLVKSLIPFSSLTFRESGVQLTIPVETESHLSISVVDKNWATLVDLLRIFKNADSS
jgi:hypothetical protein